MKSGGFHFQRLGANIRSAPALSTTHWLNTETTLMALKSGIESAIEISGFKNPRQR
jgi:hypothetical protein